jgi:hypothetical protein
MTALCQQHKKTFLRIQKLPGNGCPAVFAMMGKIRISCPVLF